MICFMFIYLCDIDDDVAGGVDDEEEVIQLRQSVCPGRPVPDVFKPKHLWINKSLFYFPPVNLGEDKKLKHQSSWWFYLLPQKEKICVLAKLKQSF